MTSLTTMFWISKAQILANWDGGQPPISTTPTFPKPQKYTRDKKWNFMQYCICIYNLTVSILHELSLLKIYTVMNLFKWFSYGRPTFSQTDLVSQFEFYPFSRCGYLKFAQNEDRKFTDQIMRIIPFLLVYYIKIMMKHRCYNHTIMDSLIALTREIQTRKLNVWKDRQYACLKLKSPKTIDFPDSKIIYRLSCFLLSQKTKRAFSSDQCV